MKDIISALEWRYATEVFQSKSVPPEHLDKIIESARLAPSSMNFQPWKMIWITDTELKGKIYHAGFKQDKIQQAPHLLILASRNTLEQKDVDKVIDTTKSTRNVTEDDLKGYRSMLESYIQGKSPSDLAIWSAKQSYIALGFMLETAALLGVDAAPMEGFSEDKVNNILNLPTQGYSAITLIAFGYRSPEDIRINWPKVRFPKDTIVESR